MYNYFTRQHYLNKIFVNVPCTLLELNIDWNIYFCKFQWIDRESNFVFKLFIKGIRVLSDGRAAYYAEVCAPVFAATYSGNEHKTLVSFANIQDMYNISSSFKFNCSF